MIHTGISGIDEMLGGGIPEGSRVLYSMEPGVDGQLFMISTLYSALLERRRCLIIIPYTTSDIFINDVIGMKGGETAVFDKSAVFLDSRDRQRIKKSSPAPSDTQNAWKEEVLGLVRQHSIEIIFVYFDLVYEDFGIKNALNIVTAVQQEPRPAVIVEHLNLEGAGFLKQFIEKYAFDLVVSINAGFKYIPYFNFFTLIHVSWFPVKKRSVPFIVAEGRIIPYIPKIVVTGPANSGKSTFVTNASDYGESVDRAGVSKTPTTVALDFGWLHWKDFDITLYGTPGQPRFDPIIPQLIKHAMGIVLVLDVTRPDALERARHLIQISKANRLPLVIAANKKDLSHTMDEKGIHKALGIRGDVPVYFISSKNKADVRHVIESLVDCITQFPF
jgi:signal recognition particle receptor subunit beta